MNGEVQLIVKIPGTAPSGNVTATESGVLDATVSPQVAFSYPNDMSSYVGGYVQIQSPVYGDLGTFFIESVALDNPTYAYISPTNTQLFSNVPWNFAINNFDLPNFNYMEAVPSTTECYLDLFENESISQNWKFQDLSNFTAQGAFTREFRIPFSENNQKALGALFDVNVEAGTSNYFHYKLPAEIRVDTLPIATGYVRVRKVYKTMNRINEVELAFYAETPDLVRNIGDKKLSDIADLTTLDEVINYGNVTNPNTTRIFTILDRGQRWSEGGEANTRSLITASTPVWPADLTPALNWAYLFDKIITEAGFELVAGTLINAISSYWMPWCNSRQLVGSDSYNEQFFRAYNSANQSIPITATIIPVNTEVFDNGGDFNTGTYSYVTPTDGYYTFRINAKFQLSGAISTFVNIGLLIDSVFVQIDTFSVGNNDIVDTTFRIGIDAASNVQLQMNNTNNTTTLTLLAGDGTYSKSLFELVKTEFNFGQTIYYNLNAPDMKQIDFVTDVIKMHNCAIVPDRAIPNKLYVVPQNSYLGSGDVLDWTSKLDTSKDVVIGSTTDLQKAKFQFTYTAGEDVISKLYKNAERIYGDYEAVGYTINPNTTPSDFAIGDQKIQLVTRSTPAGVIKGSGFIMPVFLNDQQEFIAPGPRCLFHAGGYTIQLWDDVSSSPKSEPISVLNHYSLINADIDDLDLNWAPEVPTYNITSNPYRNLFNEYWRTYMNALYSPEARMMEASFALDLKDILTFKFSDKIWIQDSYWRIVEITDYKVGMYESTKVKLLKFLEDTEDCTSTPVSVSVNGEVNFENAAGDPVASTQDCCVRYGYNWDEANAICWAFTPTGERPNSGVNGSATVPASRVIKTAVQTRSIINSVINGEDVTIEVGNKDMLAVGQNLSLTKVVDGNTMLGKNVYTNLPGIHVGGGYRGGDIANAAYTGWAQFGQFVLQRQFTVATSGTTFNLYIEGVAGQYINIPDDTVLSVVMNVSISDGLGNYETSLHHFTLDKFGAIANASAITTLNTIGAIGTNVFTFGIDTATNTDEHRINVTVTGGTYPLGVVVTASIQYQQVKTSI